MASVPVRVTCLLCLCASLAAGARAGETALVRTRLLRDAEFVARVAELVVEATAGKQKERSSRVEFEIKTVIKGTTDAVPLIVDMAKAPFGRWPKEGTTAILCLERGPDGDYLLQSNYASVIPSVGNVRDTVAGWFGAAEEEPARTAPSTPAGGDSAPAPGKRPEPEATSSDPYAELARTCDAVLVGSVSKIKRSSDERFSASASFGVAEGVYGFAGYKKPITILIPATGDGSRPPAEGWNLGFFEEIETGEGLLALAMVRLVGGEKDEKLKVRIKEAVKARTGELTTVGATLRLWEQAWNRRDLQSVIKCYSKRSALRRRYNAGGQRRERLAKQVEQFKATVSIALHKIEPAKDDEADVSVTIEFLARGRANRKEALMRLVREEGDWRILLEDKKRE